MGRRILRRRIWGNADCLCPIKGATVLYELDRFTDPQSYLQLLQWFKARQKGLFVFRSVGRHYANMSVQYTAIFHGCKNDNFQMKNVDIFLIFAPKHRLWVLVRTASLFAQNIDCVYTL